MHPGVVKAIKYFKAEFRNFSYPVEVDVNKQVEFSHRVLYRPVDHVKQKPWQGRLP